MFRRIIHFAGSSIFVEYSGEKAARIVDFLYQFLPANIDSEGIADVNYRILPGSESDRLLLYREDTLIFEGNGEADLAEMLLGYTGHDLADHSRGGLLFHSGALAWKGKGLLLPGGIATGKTTLTLWLATRGFSYLTDELVYIKDGANTFRSFTRPLNLKAPSRTVLQNDFDLGKNREYVLSTALGDLISPVLFKSGERRGETPLSLIILPRYNPGRDFIFRPLSKAQAGMELMRCLVNARNLPAHGFPEVARLVKMVPGYSMSYSHFDQIGDCVEGLFLPSQTSPQ
jgi:hypothetical protein